MENMINWKAFISNDATNAFNKAETAEQDVFEFSDDRGDEYLELINSNNKKITLDVVDETEEEIDVDDI
jgi:hypothetical protein